MRVLFAGLGSVGHTCPMVPLAIAARDVGKDFTTTADRIELRPVPFSPPAPGVRLLAHEVSTESVAEHTGNLLAGNGYRAAARAIANEIAGMPSPADVARRLPDYA